MANKQKQEISVGEDAEKLEPMCIVNGNVKWYSSEKQHGGSSKN